MPTSTTSADNPAGRKPKACGVEGRARATASTRPRTSTYAAVERGKRDERARTALQNPLDHQRTAQQPDRRAHQLHDVHLVAPRVEGEAHDGRDGEHGRDEQDGAEDPAGPADAASRSGRAARASGGRSGRRPRPRSPSTAGRRRRASAPSALAGLRRTSMDAGSGFCGMSARPAARSGKSRLKRTAASAFETYSRDATAGCPPSSVLSATRCSGEMSSSR